MAGRGEWQSGAVRAPDPTSDRPAGEDIDRRTQLSHRDFVDQYMRPNRPVIVSDAIDHWPALDSWTPDYFRSNFGDAPLGPDGMTVREVLDAVERAEHDDPGHTGNIDVPYLRNCSIDEFLPELWSDISPFPNYLAPNWFDNPLVPKRISRNRTDLFIGGRGGRFPYLHFDNYHGYAFIFQIYGRKEFITLPPEQGEFVYAEANHKGIANVSTIPDIEHPDLDRFPLFAHATPTRSMLEAGDMLFVPAGWWHTTRMPTVSISVSSNIANSFNWGALMSDHRQLIGRQPLKAVAGMPYLSVIWLWETVRDVTFRNRRLTDDPDPIPTG